MRQDSAFEESQALAVFLAARSKEGAADLLSYLTPSLIPAARSSLETMRAGTQPEKRVALEAAFGERRDARDRIRKLLSELPEALHAEVERTLPLHLRSSKETDSDVPPLPFVERLVREAIR